MATDDRRDDEINDGVLGIARGPAPQTDADRALGRESTRDEGTGTEPDPVNTSLDNPDTGTGYGVPKGPPGLHVED
jgi:hypothetical protein